MAHSEDVEERKKAAESIDLNFKDLHDKEAAWKTILLLINDENAEVREYAEYALCSVFPYLDNKKQAWNDISLLTKDKNSKAIFNVAAALEHIVPHAQDKKQAWKTIVSLTKEEDEGVQFFATDAIGSVFYYLPDKEQATEYLFSLAKEDKSDILEGVACALGKAYSQLTDKEKAWQTLISLAKNNSGEVAAFAFENIGLALPYAPNIKQANEDLLSLMEDESDTIIMGIVDVLGLAFQYIIDKEYATQYLLAHTHDKNDYIRMGVASALGSSFSFLTIKVNALDKLLILSRDKSKYVKRNVALSLGMAFPYITDKIMVLSILSKLLEDDEGEVRASANYSIGRTLIFRATEAENNVEFREELEKAIQFFERSSIEEALHKPAEFCLPFYRSFYAITSGKKEMEEEIGFYLEEAKNAIEDSNSRKKLLEAVENLSGALKIAQETDKRDLDLMKSNLNAFRRYCERACELLDSTEETAPSAVKLMRRGLPIIDERIKEILAEIQEKSEALCKQTKGTAYEDLGKDVYNIGQDFSNIRDGIGLEKSVENLQLSLDDICNRMPDKGKGDVCKLLEKAKHEQYVEDKINTLNLVLSKMPYEIRTKPSLIESFNVPATISAFVGFIGSEFLDIIPVNYNKHIVSIVFAAIIFLFIWLFTRKKN